MNDIKMNLSRQYKEKTSLKVDLVSFFRLYGLFFTCSVRETNVFLTSDEVKPQC